MESAANLVQEAAHPDANIIFGATFDDTLDDEIRVTVIATGFENGGAKLPVASAAAAADKTAAPKAEGLYTAASEKAAAPAPQAAAPAAAAPAAEEDPFDSIFKIFNSK